MSLRLNPAQCWNQDFKELRAYAHQTDLLYSLGLYVQEKSCGKERTSFAVRQKPLSKIQIKEQEQDQNRRAWRESEAFTS